MSSDMLYKVMAADPCGDPVRRLILIGIADSAPSDGRGEASLEALERISECSQEQLLGHLDELQRMGVLRWAMHPENPGAMIFIVDRDHEIFRRAK